MALTAVAMEPIEIMRDQVTVSGGPLKTPWLVNTTIEEGIEFLELNIVKNRKLRMWFGELHNSGNRALGCKFLNELIRLRVEREDAMISELKRANDSMADDIALTEQTPSKKAKRNRPKEVLSISSIVDVTYPAFTFTNALGGEEHREPYVFRVLRSKQMSNSNICIEFTIPNLMFLHEAAQDPRLWNIDTDNDDEVKDDDENNVCSASSSHPTTVLPEPRDSRIKWRQYKAQKPSMSIRYKSVSNGSVTKMRTPMLTGNPEVDTALISAAEEYLIECANAGED